MKILLPGLFLGLLSVTSQADSIGETLTLKSAGTNTYYLDTHITGFGSASLLVDTGSGYSTINQNTLTQLIKKGNATFIKTLEGVMANGSRSIVPIYQISGIRLGKQCVLNNIEVAVFPSGARQILGLNALRQVSPFIFSMDPPSLTVSNCTTRNEDEDQLVNNQHTAGHSYRN